MTATNPLDVMTLRRRLGLSQEALAKQLGTSARTIRRWEQGGVMHLIWQERLSKMWQEKFNTEEVPHASTPA